VTRPNLNTASSPQRRSGAREFVAAQSHYEHSVQSLEVLAAYEWLDAQQVRSTIRATYRPLCELISEWSGCEVTVGHIEQAASMHPQVEGSYPFYNISAWLIEPCRSRLGHIAAQVEFAQHLQALTGSRAYTRKEENLAFSGKAAGQVSPRQPARQEWGRKKEKNRGLSSRVFEVSLGRDP
jgi:hypothetical protein